MRDLEDNRISFPKTHVHLHFCLHVPEPIVPYLEGTLQRPKKKTKKKKTQKSSERTGYHAQKKGLADGLVDVPLD